MKIKEIGKLKGRRESVDKHTWKRKKRG